MSEEKVFGPAFLEIVENDRRYSVHAYSFVMNVITGMQDRQAEKKHLRGGEILEGLRSSASIRFGPMAKEVLNTWGVYTTSDFGDIVYNLIEGGLLVKTEEDDISDFSGGYDFTTVFEEDYFKK
jgi:uncharacterized repeat protein (TIGR04138 family)